jgi:hypothetical protein
MLRADENERVAALLERLLTDAAFRREFRRSPEAICRDWELTSLADELEAGSGSAFETLEIRESKSSLAGVMMAAAAEGIGVVELLRYLHGQHSLPPEVAGPVHRALTSPKLRSVPHHAADTQHAAVPEPPTAAPHTPAPEHAAPPAAAESHAAAAAAHAQPAVHPVVDGLIHHPHVHLSGHAHADLVAGAADPRVVSVLATVSAHHEIGVSVIKSGDAVHGGASISSHVHGRALDIASVDGQPVDSANVGARELAVELGNLHPSIRPAEIGSPWPIDGHGYVSGADHENHIHVGFAAPADQPVDGTPAVAPAPHAADGVLGAVKAPDQTGPRSTLPVAPAVDPEHHVVSAGAADAAAGLPDVSDAYPGDGAPQEQIAAWMARQAHKAGLPGELPVMASLVESGLHNVQGGDRDSVGFFQMRTGIWDEAPYQGFQQRPELQLKWFIDHALAVKKERVAGGERDFIHDSSKWGDWIADVERPAEEYRGRYQLRLDDAQHLLHAAGPPPTVEDAAQPGADAAAQAAAAPTDPVQVRELAAMAVAKKYLGTPYQWGGESPSTGFDCSGLMQYAYHQAGVDLPRVAEDQFNVGEHIGRDQLEPGDLVFFQDSTGYIHHVGMYIGGGKFMHAPHTGDVVKISKLGEPYYSGQFAGGRRVGGLASAGTPLPATPKIPVAGPVPQTSLAGAAPQVPVPAVSPAADVAAAQPSGSAILKAVAPPASAGPRNTVKFLPAIDPKQQVAQPAPPVPPANVQDAAAPLGTPAPVVDPAAVLPDASAAYPGDAATREQIAAWMAQQAEKAGLPRELPVMASLVESGLQNVQGGDRDSVGFFQMRTGTWDEGPYQGYERRPELQLKWFIDQAVAVRDQRLAQGDDQFVNDHSKWGDWIADVERPAAEYRGRYQLRLDEAHQLLSPKTP